MTTNKKSQQSALVPVAASYNTGGNRNLCVNQRKYCQLGIFPPWGAVVAEIGPHGDQGAKKPKTEDTEITVTRTPGPQATEKKKRVKMIHGSARGWNDRPEAPSAAPVFFVTVPIHTRRPSQEVEHLAK